MSSSSESLGRPAPVAVGLPAGLPARGAVERRARRVLPPRGPNGRFIRAFPVLAAPAPAPRGPDGCFIRAPAALAAPALAAPALVAPASAPAEAASEGARKRPSPVADDEDDAAHPPKRERMPIKAEDDQDQVVLPSVEGFGFSGFSALGPTPEPNTKAIVRYRRRKVVQEVYLSCRAGCPQRPRPNFKLTVKQHGQTRLVRRMFLEPRAPKMSPELGEVKSELMKSEPREVKPEPEEEKVVVPRMVAELGEGPFRLVLVER